MKRRTFLKYTGATVLASNAPVETFALGLDKVEQNSVFEESFRSSVQYNDPFNEVDFQVMIGFPDGRQKLYPGFWAGRNIFKFRFSSHLTGRFTYRTVSSNINDKGLHDRQGSFEVVNYTGTNELMKHGPIRVSDNKRYFTHLDGKPFLWLGDTWWCGLTKRLRWPDEFKMITNDRKEKGYNIIQFTVGLAPTATFFERKNENEAGLPWDEATNSINPYYFDAADNRVYHLVSSGIVPVVVPTWGFYILRIGAENMKKLWKYIVARWGALPVVWCLAGELSMGYYLSETRNEDGPRQVEGWAPVLSYLREINVYDHLITVHPRSGASSRDEVKDTSLIDFDMLQASHIFINAMPQIMNLLKKSLESTPVMPALVDEVAYEGIAETNWEDSQRQLFWASVLSGSPGYTYGAQGITQFSSEQFPSYIQPQGLSYGEETWHNSYKYKGGYQIGIGKKILEKFNWWEFESHPEWIPLVENTPFKHFMTYCAGIPGKVRIIYYSSLSSMDTKVLHLEPGVEYNAYYIVPSSGKQIPIGKVTGDKDGVWTTRRTRRHDLVLVMTTDPVG
jgi:hypothetical protein